MLLFKEREWQNTLSLQAGPSMSIRNVVTWFGPILLKAKMYSGSDERDTC